MTDPFPAQHTTRTIVTETHVAPQIRYDPSYIKTIPGIIKIVCIVLNFIGFLCIQVSGQAYFSRGEFFSSTAMFGFWLTIILLAMYIFHVIEKFYKIPWLKVEMYFCAVMCGFYLIASCLAVSWGQEAYTAAGFFGFCAMLAYGYDAYLKFISVKAGEIAQGERVVHQQATVVTTY